MFSSFKINKVIEQWLSWARKGIHPSPCPVIVSNTSSQSQDTGWNRTISIPEVHGTLADLAWGSHRKYHRNTEDTWGFSVCIEETRWQEGRHTCLRTRRQQPSVEGLKEREAQRGRLWRLSALLSTFPCSTFPWSHQSCQISYPLGFVCEAPTLVTEAFLWRPLEGAVPLEPSPGAGVESSLEGTGNRVQGRRRGTFLMWKAQAWGPNWRRRWVKEELRRI